MRVLLRQASTTTITGWRIVDTPGDDLIEAEIDTRALHDLGLDIIRWRGMDFTYDGMEHGMAVYSRATGITINWYPEPDGEPFRGRV